MSVVHDFGESLAKSHAAEDLPFWKEVYRKSFPTMIGMYNHRQDGDHQRQGIDRSIVLENSKQILIDEKVRYKNQTTGKIYDDILLEYWSNEGMRVPGWVCKPLLCDYIAYAIAPLGICYLLPVLQLQSAWSLYGQKWIAEFTSKIGGPIRAKNKCTGGTYTTVSIAVPAKTLYPAIGAALRANFTPPEQEFDTEINAGGRRSTK